MKFFILAFFFSSFSLAEDLNQFSNQLEKIRFSNQAPALAGLLCQHGKILKSAAVGLRKNDNPTAVAEDDKFHLGSDTKAMTATLLAMFVDENKLK